MQALSEVRVTRAWQWGIAIVSDPSLGGQTPDVQPGVPVSADANGLVILVRHAQDIASFDDDFEFAEATVAVRHWPSEPAIEPDRTAIFAGTILTPTGKLWIGDAEHETVTDGPSPSAAIRVTFASHDVDSPNEVWVDAWQG